MQTALRSYLDERADVIDRLRRTLVEALDLRVAADEIDPDAALFGTGLRLDSIDALELVVAVEAEFGIELTEDGTAAPSVIRTLNTLADRILDREGP